MKAVLQAGWLLTVAVGNFIVLIVSEIARLPKQVSFNVSLLYQYHNTLPTATTGINKLDNTFVSPFIFQSGPSTSCFPVCCWRCASSSPLWHISTRTLTLQKLRLSSRTATMMTKRITNFIWGNLKWYNLNTKSKVLLIRPNCKSEQVEFS